MMRQCAVWNSTLSVYKIRFPVGRTGIPVKLRFKPFSLHERDRDCNSVKQRIEVTGIGITLRITQSDTSLKG